MLSIFSCGCQTSLCLLWRNVLFRSFAHFFDSAVFFNIELYGLFVYFENFLQNTLFANIFSHYEAVFSFCVCFPLWWKRYEVLIMPHAFVFISINLQIDSMIVAVLLLYSSACVFLNEFYSIFSYLQFSVCGSTMYSHFILLHNAVQFSKHHILKKWSFLHCTFLLPSMQTDYRCREYFWTFYPIP